MRRLHSHVKGVVVLGVTKKGKRILLLREVEEKGFKAVVAVREGMRKRAREMYEEHREVYGLRYMVESWIGAVKGLSGKSIEMAKKAVWGKMILWNMGLVIFLSRFFGVIQLRCLPFEAFLKQP